MLKSPLLAMCLGGLFLATPIRAEEPDRAVSEGSALFHVIMMAEPSPEDCQYGSDWYSWTIPEYVAKKFLGLTLHADLLVPRPGLHLAAALDPRKRFPSAFCDQAKKTAYEKAQFDAFATDKSARTVRIESTGFTFPVFNADYQKAVVIISRSVIEERDRLTTRVGTLKPGAIMRFPGSGVELANLYVKRNGVWTLSASEVISQS